MSRDAAGGRVLVDTALVLVVTRDRRPDVVLVPMPDGQVSLRLQARGGGCSASVSIVGDPEVVRLFTIEALHAAHGKDRDGR
jgi:hypothetical protein